LSDLRFNRDGTVLELGPDLKERWRISGLAMPTDAQLLSNGTLAISGQHSSGITIRDTEGRLLANRPVTIGMRENVAVQQLQWLPNDHLLLVGRNAVVELKKDSDTLVMQYSRPQHDILSARRLPDGTTAVLIQNGNAPFNCFFLDSNGKPLPDRRLTIGPLHYQGAVMDAPAPNRLLVTEQARVTEYDTQTGKSVWQYSPGGQPRSVQRLPNGNTLLVVDGSGGMFSNATDPGRVIEVTPEGDEVWTYQLDSRAGGLVLAKAYRR
jgi:hypothetical protein